LDRQTIYFGQVPLETDLLSAQQDAMVGLAKLAAGVFGTNTLVNAFTCTPTSPAGLTVQLTPGEIYQLENLEQTAWSSLPANIVYTVLKQGIQLGVVQFGITPPAAVGYSQVFLIEVQYQDLDTGLVTLPYFNSANPASPFMGPGNSGQAQNTIRQGIVASQVKAGIAAPTGTQVTPTADAGWTGIFTVTVPQGTTAISAGMIATVAQAPFLQVNGYLPQIPFGVQDSTWTFCPDSSPGGPPIATSATTTTASAVLNFSGGVPATVAVGMRAYDTTTPGAITGGQTVQSKTATTVTLTGNVNATVGSGDLIAFSTNAYAGSVVPSTAPVLGMSIQIKAASTNTGAATFNLNGSGAVAIHRANGFALAAGDIQANQIVALEFDGSFWQISNYTGVASTSSTVNNFTSVNIPSAVDSGTANNIIASFSPAITSLTFGLLVMVKIANANTGTTQITVNALAPVGVIREDGSQLFPGDIVAGEAALLAFDGTNFQVVNYPATVQSIPVGNPTVYVRTDGNDNNTGLTNSPSGAWRTIQHAIARAQNIWNLQGKILTIQLGIPGTYDAFVLGSSVGSVTVQGDIAAQGSYIITGTVPVQGQTNGFILVTGATLILKGVTIANTGNTNTVTTNFGGSITLDHVTLTQPSGTNTFAVINAQAGGSIAIGGPITIQANAGYGILAAAGSISVNITTITFAGSPNFTNAVCEAFSGGIFVFTGGAAFSGSCSGTRYQVQLNGVLNTNTGNVNFIPGTAPGFTATGGQYN